MHDDDEQDWRPPPAILAAFINYGNLMDEAGFNDLVCGLEDAGLIHVPPTYWLN